MDQPFDGNTYSTLYIKDEISKCENVNELREKIFPMIKSQQQQWAKKIAEIVKESGLNKSQFSETVGVSRVALNKWFKGSVPRNRETFLKIGMAAGYGREKIDQLLQRYGKYPALYVKSLEDCVCVYVINQGYGKESLAKYNYILNVIKDNIIGSDGSQASDMETEVFDEKLSDVRDETGLEIFIRENSSTFLSCYHRFYAYVKMHIEVNYEGFGGSVYELAEGQGWSSSLKQCVSAINQKKWYPTRNKIISLGLHLSMDHDQIDEMLGLAYMEPLCAKNLFESVIMFILDDASLNNMLDRDSEAFDPDELCRYAKNILEKLNLPEVESFIAEISEIDDE